MATFTDKQIETFKKFIRNNPDWSAQKIANELGLGERTIRIFKNEIRDEELAKVEQLSHEKAQLTVQKLRDTQRIERAAWRREARVHGEMANVLADLIEAIPQATISTKHRACADETSNGVLIIQLSDLHIGQTINLPNNEFNTLVASKRLFSYVSRAIEVGQRMGVNRAVLALTGDLNTSDRRTGEVAAMEYNRSLALQNTFEIISGIIELVSQTFKLEAVISVLGNEARLEKDLELGHKNFYNNFDWLTHRMLEARYGHCIRFSDMGNPVERVISVEGQHILVAHGLVKAQTKLEDQFAYYKTKYPSITYAMVGHVHDECVTKHMSRSSGLPGSNEYSVFTLGLPRNNPGQTFHIVDKGGVLSFPVSLVNTGEAYFAFTAKPDQKTIENVVMEV